METALSCRQSSGHRAPIGRRTYALTGAIMISTLAALLVGLFSTGAAVDGSLAARAAVPGRMLLLVMAATLLLPAGEGWRCVGLRTPASLGRAAALVICGYLAVAATMVVVTKLFLPALGLVPETATTFAGLRGNLGEYLYWLIPVAWGSAAFGEELVFRGFLQTRLESMFGTVTGATAIAAIGQAIIFGSLHAYLGLGGAILAGATGLVIGLVYVAGGRNLWICIILHGMIDTVSLTAIYLGAAG